jgi:nucleoid DNA-binding protein
VNAAELADRLARRAGLSQRAARGVVEAILAEIIGELAANQSVTLRGFGSFHVRDMPARERRHPKTGDIVMSPTRRAVTFRAGRDLDEALGKPRD